MSPRNALRLALLLGILSIAVALSIPGVADEPTEKHRSPVAIALSNDGQRLLTANQTSNSVSLVDVSNGSILAEVTTGEKPVAVALSKDGKRGIVAHWFGYDVAVLEIGPSAIEVLGRVNVGPEPRGVVLSSDGKTAYVTVGVANEVVRVDTDSLKITGRVEVGREPRGIAITPDGSRLLVGNARAKSLSIITTADFKVERTQEIDGDNLRQVTISADGKTGLVANMRNRRFATTRTNIDKGWVLGQRLTRVTLDGSEPFDTLSLDPEGLAAGDAHGIAISNDAKILAVSCGGTHEVMLFRTDAKDPLPWRENNSRDLMVPDLARDRTRFQRVALGGRPTEIAFAADGRTLFVANYLNDSVQIVDAESAKLLRTIALGSPKTVSVERRGEALFHDAVRSFNQWYSCNTCHSEGHTGGLDFDTMNDGWQDNSNMPKLSRKKVPTLRGVAKTGPWTWHGWQKSLDDAMVESFTKSMQGKAPKQEEVDALIAYLKTLEYPKNPYLAPDGSLTESARRGETIFRSSKAACNSCHGGAEYSDGKIHVVGLEDRRDVYKGFNPPSLRGTYDKDPYLHDGRSKTLKDALIGPHNPEDVTGLGTLTEPETDDLIAYLRSL